MQTDEQPDLIYSVAATPDARQIFAAQRNGLYDSSDAGKTWRYAYRSFLLDQALPTLSVAISPAFERDQTVMAGVPGAILRSLDGGETWTISRLEEPAPLVSGIAFSPAYERDGTVLAVTSDDGVFCSVDYGATWNNWNFGLLDANGLCLAISPEFARDRTVFAGTTTGLFRSTNGAKSWQVVELPCQDGPVLSLTISPDYGRDSTLFVGTDANGLFRSTDGGKTWAQMGGHPGYRSFDSLLMAPNLALVALVDQTLCLSTDQGATFRPWPDQNLTECGPITAIASLPEARLIVAQSDRSIVVMKFE